MNITKIIASTGKKIETMDITTEVTVSSVVTKGFPKPAVETVDPNLVALAELFTTAAVPPPAIMARAQVTTGLRSATVDTIIVVPARVASGIAIASKRLSTTGI